MSPRFALGLIAITRTSAQETVADESQVNENKDATAVQVQELKRSFMGIELGQTPGEFRRQLSRQEAEQADGTVPDSYYYFLYDLFSSDIEEGGRQETLIEVKGNGFIDKGLFQFASYGEAAEPRLVAITIFLNTQWSSYEQMFEKLRDDYGNPEQLNPQRVLWQNQQTIVTLEKQLRYKIVDKIYLEGLQADEQKELDFYQYNYEEFVKKF